MIIEYQSFNGNQADVNTHISNWDGLREFLAKEYFIYIADSKRCSEDNMHHIEKNGGKFITIMPKNRKEVSQIHERLQQGEKIEWLPTYSTQHSRKKGQLIIYQTYAVERSWEGYHIIWVHASSKEKIDFNTRERRIAKAEEGLKELLPKLNKYYLKTKDQIQNAIEEACKGTKNFVTVDI